MNELSPARGPRLGGQTAIQQCKWQTKVALVVVEASGKTGAQTTSGFAPVSTEMAWPIGTLHETPGRELALP